MPVNLEPYPWNFATITAGDTFPSARWVESASDNLTSLSRVRIKIKDSAGVTFATLDSNATGITINVATAGSWEWTIASLIAPTEAGIYRVDMETTDSAGVISTLSSGQWEILEQITD